MNVSTPLLLQPPRPAVMLLLVVDVLEPFQLTVGLGTVDAAEDMLDSKIQLGIVRIG